MAITDVFFPQGNYLDIKANAPTRRDYNINVTADLVNNLPPELSIYYPAAAAAISLPYDSIQALTRTTDKDFNQATTMGGLTSKEIAADAFGTAFAREDPFTSLRDRTIGASKTLAEQLANINLAKTVQDPTNFSFTDYLQGKYDINQGLDSFNNLVSDTARAEPYNMASDTVRAEPQIAQTEPAARNNQADILQIINQMEEEKKNYYTQPEEEPDFIDKMLSSLQKGAQYYGGSQIGAGIGSLAGLGPLGIVIGALTGGKFLGGADTSMTPMDRYNVNTFGGYGNMGVQDRYGINTVSLFGDYNRYANRMANKPGPFQSYYQDVVNKQNKQEAQQFADIRQQSESSGGYNPSTGYTAETASDLAGTGSGSVEFSSPF